MKNRYLRVKGSVKRQLGISSGNHGSTSLPDLAQPIGSPSPVPPGTRHPVTPLPANPDAEVPNPSSSTTPAPTGSPSTETPSSARDTQDESFVKQTYSATGVPSSDFPLFANVKSTPEEYYATVSSWSGLNLLVKALDATAGIFPPFKAAISEFRRLLQAFEASLFIASKDSNGYIDLQAKLDRLLGDLSQHLNGLSSPKMTTSVRNLCTGIGAELQIIEQKLTKSTFQRHFEAIDDPDQVLECYRRIQAHLERLSLNANLSVWETVDELAREARLRQLSPTTSAVYNSAKSEEIQRRACTEGTRQGELAKLLEWARNTSSGEVYWMNGMAGTGKTTIAYSLCAELETTAELGASFFCSRLIPECRDVKLIIPSIAYQLARFSFPFCSVLLNVLQADPDVHTRTLKIQFDSLVVKPLLQAEHTLPTGLTVVIDALDECEHEDSVGQILDILLSQTTTPHLPIRFLLSSRPEPLIYSRMMDKLGAKHEARLILHELDEEKVRHDIETYLKVELEQVNLESSQLAALATHCGVLFIYASTAARYIKGGLYPRQRETRLNAILGLGPPSNNGQDRDIDTLYISILKNAFENQNLDQSDQVLMKVILGTAICAQEPLTTVALASLLRLQDTDQVHGLLGPLRSVLNITEKTGLITTLHASFPDFMFDPKRSANFHCDSRQTHAQIAQACFTVIGSNIPQFNLCTLESSYLRDNDVSNITKHADLAVSAELFYACLYWVAHLELGKADDSGRDLIYDFLSNRLLLWMEVLNLKACIQLGPRILQRAADWSRAHAHSGETTDLAHDAWRFATMYASHAISQSTPHIYVSMLPFWPESSPITRHYNKQIQKTIQIRGSAITRRQLALLATWPLDGTVWSFCFSPDESLIACAVNSSVWILDGTTGRIVLGPLEHSDRINGVAFSPNGALIVSGSHDNMVKVWKTNNGQLLTEPLEGHTDLVTAVAFSPDGGRVISGSRDGTVRVWIPESGRTVLGPLRGQNPWVWSVCVSSDGTRIASGHDDGTIQVWDAESGAMLYGPLKGHSGRVSSLCFSPDGTRLASSSGDTTLRIWNNLADHLQVDVLEGHLRPVTSVAFSPDGKQLVSGSFGDVIRLWDVQGAPQLARVFTGHTNVVWCVRFSSDGARIVSSSGDRTIRVWDARSQGPTDIPLEGHTQPVTSVAYSRDGTRIVSGSNDRAVYVWDEQSGQVAVGPMEGHTDWVDSVSLSPDQTRIASGSKDTTIQLWDARTGKAVGKSLTPDSGTAFSVCFSPDGTLLAASFEDETIQLWNAESGEPIGSPLKAHTSWIRSVCFSPDSLRLVSGSSDKTALVWDVNTRKTVLPPFEGHTDEIFGVCASPDGTRIASGSKDTTVRLWDAYSGQSVFGPLQGHTALVNSVSFSPDSAYVVSASDDKTIRIWDVRLGQAVGSPLIGHTHFVMSVAFSPNGRQIISGSADLSIRVWDVADLVQAQGSQGDTNEDTESPRAHQPWVLQDDGWVVDSESRLLAWVPPDLHASLMNPRNPLLISTKGSIQLDLERAKLGESWSECYKP